MTELLALCPVPYYYMFVLIPAQVLVLVLVLESQVLDNNTANKWTKRYQEILIDWWLCAKTFSEAMGAVRSQWEWTACESRGSWLPWQTAALRPTGEADCSRGDGSPILLWVICDPQIHFLIHSILNVTVLNIRKITCNKGCFPFLCLVFAPSNSIGPHLSYGLVRSKRKYYHNCSLVVVLCSFL